MQIVNITINSFWSILFQNSSPYDIREVSNKYRTRNSFRAEDGGSMFLRNAGIYLQV
jgi:hypothetical protein